MKKKQTIYEYEGMYPLRLYITSCSNSLPEDLVHRFTFYKIFKDRLFEDARTDEEAIDQLKLDADGSAMFVSTVVDKDTKKYGGLIVFSNPSIDLDNVIAHESCHITDLIYELCNLTNLNFSEGNETYAYLCGWVAESIWNASRKLGIENTSIK